MKVYLTLLVPVVLWGLMFWAFPTASATDGFVRMLEMRFAMQPGQTRVLPECGCTIRYLGTSANGRHYVVRIDRLD